MDGSRASIYDVAARAGVSTATVSRVVHDRGGFSERTRKAVLAAIEELRWLPSGSAQALAARRTGVVGLLFADLGASADVESEALLFVDQVIRGAERAATLAGRALLLAGTRGPTGRDRARFVAGHADGLVVQAGCVSAAELRRLARVVPVVVVAPGGSAAAVDTVAADGRSGSRELGLHLAEDHGYRNLAFVGGPPGSPDAQDRFVGHAQACAEAGLDVPAAPDAVGDFTESGGAAATEGLLAGRSRPPRAVVYANDQMAIGGLAVLRRRRLRVPEDVAVVGFDDLTSARYLRPSLTTVRQPMRAIGEQAVNVLFDRSRNPGGMRRDVLMPTELILRRSCGCRPSPRTRSGATP